MLKGRGRGSTLAMGVAGGTVNENVLCIEKSMHHSRLACPGKGRRDGREESREYIVVKFLYA